MRPTLPKCILHFSIAFPANMTNWISIWRRNCLVWRKLGILSMFGNLADPVIYLFGLGLGLGAMVGNIEGVSYISFLAAGTVSSSIMMSASFESMYSVFSRMHVQRSWEAIMHTPLSLGDILIGEIIWTASKALLSGIVIIFISSILGYASLLSVFTTLPVIALAGLAFASLAMIVTSVATSYDFFMFYQRLVLTPMLLLSGAFFPIKKLPEIVQHVSHLLPLVHAIELIRPAMLGQPATHIVAHITILIVYILVGFIISASLFQRRMSF
ncbi:MAG: ABC transporter permease [Burkholderia sp.]|nr:ABC transporter permease [Burkholderia sp.]